MTVEASAFKAVMGQWPSGVTVVTTADADGCHGMTASSFSSVSLDPALVSVCIARNLHTHDRVAASGIFAVNILDKDQVDMGLRFAGMLPGVEDRFAGIDVTTAVSGAPLLPDTLGWLDCRVWQAYDGGDHTIFVGEVLAAGTAPTASPLLYHSRSWGQFADVLAAEAHVAPAAQTIGPRTAVITNAFGDDPSAPASVAELVARVHAAVDGTDVEEIVLDDAVAAADPVLVRRVLQALAGFVGHTRVVLRPGAGPMALANVVVALKSGVEHIQGSADGEPYVPVDHVTDMLDRMGVTLRTPIAD